MARSPANVRSSTSAAQPHHRLTGEIRALRHRPQGPFFVRMGGGGQGVGALYDHRCTRRAAMHEKGFDALGASACTWWSSVQLEKLGALGKLRCTWRPLSAEKTVVRCIGVREVHGGFRNASKFSARIEAQRLHRRFVGQDLAVEVRWASVYSTQVWKSVCNCSKYRWKNVVKHPIT